MNLIGSDSWQACFLYIFRHAQLYNRRPERVDVKIAIRNDMQHKITNSKKVQLNYKTHHCAREEVLKTEPS